ncbi:MAG: anaerobic ribonucleoside-triphosphate reductase activating protein [Muribaculaceae bacterium]|nr:anaerobic ribonucleoside-triphosphate reductase activating protein [Muribaculaceae bacterium]MDE7369666.1 anaerobic ribonucleoside-triphosphate reductase activating protein [Muribaculaceae bacterium]
MRVIDIVDGTSVDGPGLRTTIYFAGCKHHCPGCHNPQTWSFDAGRDMNQQEIIDHIVENDFDVTFSGGDPMYQSSDIIPLAKQIKSMGKTIWCYTGFLFEEILSSPEMSKLLPYIDVVVDGLFVESLKDTELIFRGSSNQRIIDVPASIESGKVVFAELF